MKKTCYPFQIDGIIHDFKSPLGGLIQGDVENRYDPPTGGLRNSDYAIYKDLYPNFVDSVFRPYVKRNTIPPPSIFGNNTGLSIGEYKYNNDGQSYANNKFQKIRTSDVKPQKIDNVSKSLREELSNLNMIEKKILKLLSSGEKLDRDMEKYLKGYTGIYILSAYQNLGDKGFINKHSINTAYGKRYYRLLNPNLIYQQVFQDLILNQ